METNQIKTESSPPPRGTSPPPKFPTNSPVPNLDPGDSMPESSIETPDDVYQTPSLVSWAARTCEGKAREAQVQILEEASAYGHIYLGGMKKTLEQFVNKIPSVEARIKEIDEVIARHKRSHTMVGFLGSSGTGKSSLLNELLEEQLLPHSEEQASTAVAVEIAYNESEDPKCKYKAQISGISTKEFRQELDKLYEDREAWLWAPDPANDEERDPYILERINTTMSKVTALFPHIVTVDDLDKTSVADLLATEVCERMLDEVLVIQGHDPTKFARSIKGYIDTTNSNDVKEHEYSLWPLVKVVKLYIKSDILKNGITLVDLPGSHDTSAARVNVADQYQKKLNITCVVAPAVRAASDKAAHDLLSSDKRRMMQLDGRYDSKSLYFVVTKIDDLTDLDSYIRDHPNLQSQLSAEVQKKNQIEDELDILNAEINSIQTANQKASTLLQRYEVGVQKSRSGVEETWRAVYDQAEQQQLQPLNRKRKLDDVEAPELSSATAAQKKKIHGFRDLVNRVNKQQETVRNGDITHSKAQEKKQKLQRDRSKTVYQLARACIINRNELQIKIIQAGFRNGRREMGEEDINIALKIYCASAHAAGLLRKGKTKKARELGFNSLMDTGIPDLKNALIATTWDARESSALQFNLAVDNCATRIQFWCARSASSYYISTEQRGKLMSRFDNLLKGMDQKITTLFTNTHSSIEKLLRERLFSKMDEMAKAAGATAETKVIEWAMLPVKWNTHRAINNSDGVHKSYKGTSYNWNEDLNSCFNVVYDWHQTFSQIGKRQTGYKELVKDILEEFKGSLMVLGDDMPSSVNDSLYLLKDTMLDHHNALVESGAQVLEDLNEAGKDTHRDILDTIRNTWLPVYRECGSARGKGHWKENQTRHREHAKGKGGRKMYQSVCNRIKTSLRKQCAKIPKALNQGYSGVASQIKTDLDLMMDQLTVSDAEADSKTVASKAELRRTLIPQAEKLQQSLSNTVIVEDIVQPEVPFDAMEVDTSTFLEQDKEAEEFDQILSQLITD